MTKTPLRARMMSASGVVGPLAASARILGRTRSAFSAVIWLSSAAGTRTSTSSSSRAALLMGCAPGKPATVPCSAFQARTALTSRPAGRWMPPAESETATTRDAGLGDEGGDGRAGVAEALDGDRRAIEVKAQVAGRLDDGDHGAAPGGLHATLGAAQADGLAGDDRRHGVPDVHRVRVHDPGHRLSVGVDIRARGCPSRVR